MSAHKPEECDLLLIEAIQQGDLDAAVDLYEPDASFVIAPGQVVTGHAAIREVLQTYSAAMATGQIDAVTVITSPDGSLAVTRTKGSMVVPGPDGKPVTTPLHSVEVVRKQPDGTWRFVIDDGVGEGLQEIPVRWRGTADPGDKPPRAGPRDEG